VLVSGSRYIRLVVGLAILAVLLLSVDHRALLTQFATLRPDYLLAAATCIAVATLLGSVNAYLIVAIDSPVRYRRFLSFYWFSWALGLVVPGQVGDVAGLTYLMKRAGLDWTKIVGRALLDKLISFAVMLALAGIALARFSALVRIELATLVAMGAFAIAVVAGLFYLVRGSLPDSPRARKLFARIRSGASDVLSFMRSHPMLVGVNLVGTTLKILLIGTAYWFVFQAGGADNLPWLDIVLLVTVSSLVAYIPISFNGLGTVEITGILLFSLLGLSEELVLSSYLVLRATVLLIAWLPSLPIMIGSAKQHR
jgi:uncharacterized membrane protein YbhN (UPF0104 family)